MDFYVCTLFPEMIESAARTSILGRALQKGAIRLETVDIRAYSCNRHMRVDDYPYGGGAGMVIEAEPVFRAVNAAKEKAGALARVVYLTPQAEVLGQTKVEELACEESLILLCGHYEGIDERVLEEVVTDYLSIGDYVLTGGELPALVLMDAVSRFVPGVLSNDESARFESMTDGLIEYPHYTRPDNWRGREVPPVLLSGDHKKIEEWRHERAVERTRKRRPDLFENRLEYTVCCLGGERTAESAAALCSAVCAYGSALDLGRAKLQREKRVFGANDVVILVCESADDVIHMLKNMSAQESKAFLVFSGVEPCREEAAARAALCEKGFTCLGAFAASHSSSRILAIEIKSAAERARRKRM